MSNDTSNEEKLRYFLRKVTADLRASNRRVAELEGRDTEPLALVGMACRYPGGVRSAEQLWQLVVDGGDAITGFPADRGWDIDAIYHPEPGRAGTTYTREGGFLHDAAEFDPAFFGISPREALAMDPQQRLLLETSWEALEDACIDPVVLRGSDTGVFFGSNAQDYEAVAQRAADSADGYLLTGTAGSVLSGRVAYALGLEGPAVTVDTACSSSLVALHWAGQALRRGECSMALAGGVAIMSTPTGFVEFARQRGLAADGRCKSFAAAADGTSWSEGVGVVVLERLADARAKGHPVLAILRGSAVNQDGASNGLTAPHGPAQRRVIRRALAAGGLTTRDIDLVEAHGTGTALGDPIEARALLDTYGLDREPGNPLRLGSIKSNIGHTQAAAGIAGVIKVVLAMRHGLMPRTLHVDQPTPHVDWRAGGVELLTEATAWPENGQPRRAAVSSFGISGTNAHVILEQAPGEDTEETARPGFDGPVAWVLSGRGRAAVAGQAARLRDRLLAHPELAADSRGAADLGWSLVTTRAIFEDRAVVVGRDRETLLAGLDAVATGVPHPNAVLPADARSGVGFLFAGQGAQRAGMGKVLAAAFPVFADALEQVCSELDRWLPRPLREVLFAEPGSPDAALLHDTGYTQPALFAVEVALFRLLESWSVTPDHLLGHSIGGLVAAHVAGVLSLPDAARVVAERGRLMQLLPAGGAMASIRAGHREVLESFATVGDVGDRVSIAAVNAPDAVVISGDLDAVTAITEHWSAASHRTRRLTVSHAFHSQRMEPMLDEFRAVLEAVELRPPAIPVISDSTGEPLTAEQATSAEYWVRHVRATVRFADALAGLAERGTGHFLELGDGGLASLTGPAGVALLRGEREAEAVLLGVARLFTAGVDVDWAALYSGSAPQRVGLPSYAFQRQRYWLEPDGAPAEPRDDADFWRLVEAGAVGELAPGTDTDAAQWNPVLRALTEWRTTRRARSRLDAWRYRVRWQPAPAPAGPARLTGTWLIVAAPEHDDLAATCARAVTEHGASAHVLDADPAADRHTWAARLGDVLQDRPAGVLSLLGMLEDPAPGTESVSGVSAGLASTVALVQGLGDAGVGAPLWSLTRGAVAVGPAEVVAPVRAMVDGLGRVVALEHPERWGGSIDLPEVLDTRAEQALAAVLAGTAGEDQVAIRSAGVFLRRLTQAPSATAPATELRGTVLITGGTGALGAHVARWAAAHGAERLVLLSRRGPAAPGADDLRAELHTLAPTVPVQIVACDITDRSALAAVLAAVPADHPLSTVVHTAGVLDDGTVDTLTPERLATVLTVKRTGAWHLHELTAELPLAAFVLFSSAAGVWGSGGQGGYAAANAYLDALAEYRHRGGLPATAIAWGPWAEAGMAAGDLGDRLDRRGLAPLPPDSALRALGHAIDGGDVTVAVADVDWRRFHPHFTALRPSPLLGGIPEVMATPAGADRASGAGGSEQLAHLVGAAAPERRRAVLDLVRATAARVLGHPTPDSVGTDRTFRELGIDSLTAIELAGELSRATGVAVPSTLAFDYPTVTDTADFVIRALSPDDGNDQIAPQRRTASDEPLALVGMACRLPGGVASPEQFWRLIAEGGDAIGGFPEDRGWDLDALYDPDPESAGTTYARDGGFLHDAGGFDARFFGISPREALAMDPQQRLLLEIGWEALENAGIDPKSLRGSDTGVFAGASYHDYATRLDAVPPDVEGYMGTGNAGSVVSGRLAYVLGLEGPALTVDTACSSSLVALHLAGQALRRGECSLALAGGVAVMSTPEMFVEFSRQRGLAVDGRCKSFAGAADGTGWGEGVGIVVLERLSDAEAKGHRVLAVLRGSAVNQDGASNGLTAPNGPSQQRVIRQALAAAGLTTADVDVVEAHGTGTALGDPIEAQALLATYGRDREPEHPLWLGSVKSNIGHTQAAAGVAGVIKMVLALRHRVLPATLHVDEPTPHVDWGSGAVELLTAAREWPDGDRPRRAAVSSFGISGTNAHLVLEQAPDEVVPERPADAAEPVAWVVSGRGPDAVAAQAGRLAEWLREHPESGTAEVARALLGTRSLFEDRAVVVGAERAALLAGLDAAAAGVPHPGVLTGTAGVASGVVFVFPGQGGQWVGMGRELLATTPVFADRMAACEAALEPWVEWSLRAVIESGDAELLARVDVVQPVLWAVMVSLAAVWEGRGVRPAAVIGHSQGEIAAAVVAGALTLADGARVVAVRSAALRALGGTGAMLSVALPVERLRLDERVSVAAVNGPAAVVLSGPADALAETVAGFDAEVRTRWLPVDYASHSPAVQVLRDELAEALAGITPRAGLVPVYSTVTAELLDTTAMDPGYWYDNLRGTVAFHAAVTAAIGAGHTTFLEVSPHPVLAAPIQETLDDLPGGGVVTGSLRRDQPERLQLLTAAARLFVTGTPIELADATDGPWIPLPTYAFQHERYWLQATAAGGDAGSLGLGAVAHPLLGAASELAETGTLVLSGRIAPRTQPWVADHVVHGSILLPGTAFVELALCAADRIGYARVAELIIHTPLELSTARDLQVLVARPGAERTVDIYSRPHEDEPWTHHATGTLAADPAAAPEPAGEWPPAGAVPVATEELYDRLDGVGLGYGPAFRGLRAAWRHAGDIYAEVVLPGAPDGFGVHPALLDAALHAIGETGIGGGAALLPFAWTGIELHATDARALRVRLHRTDPTGDTVALTATDPSGAPVISIEGLTLRPVDADRLPTGTTRDLYTVAWTAHPGPAPDDTDSIALLTIPDLSTAAPGEWPVHSDLDTLLVAPPELVVLPLTGTAHRGRPATLVAPVLELVQRWLRTPELADTRLAVLTRGAIAAAPGDEVCDPAAAAVWGLIRSVDLEHPGRFLLLDADTAGYPASLPAHGESQLALRDGQLLVPRLRPAVRPPDAADRDRSQPGTVLITGGTGVLGGALAGHLVANGARRLLLTGRRGIEAPGAGALADRLRALGAHVDVVACDTADRQAVAALLDSVPAEHPLTAVVHAAGVLDDGTVEAMDREQLLRVLTPKADAAWVLHELTAGIPLTDFVLFSSATGAFGNAGQSGYGAANAYLDALAHHRRALGLTATSLGWGLWAQTSAMTGRMGERGRARLTGRGAVGLGTEQGLALFDAATAMSEPHLLPVQLDRGALRRNAENGSLPSVFRELVRVPRRRARTEAGGDDFGKRLARLAPAERHRIVTELVTGHVAGVLGHADPAAITIGRPFRELGFDSLSAIDLRNRLGAATGLRLPASLIFDYPTPERITGHILDQLGGRDAPAAAPAAPVLAVDEPVAVVGMACRLPGGVGSAEELWQLVLREGDGITPFPADRGWDLAGLYDPDPEAFGKTYGRSGGFLPDAGHFDAGFFGISPREALAMDPQQRLLLETAWEAIEHAGIDPKALQGSDTGVFAGVMYHDYSTQMSAVPDGVEAFLGTGNASSVVSGRIAYALGLEGPAVTVDTACSSSLVALHWAGQALRRGECSLALAGGVTVMATPGTFLDFSRQRGLAADGRCKAFGAEADGFGPAEGVGVLVLERLSDARANGHRVLAVLRGSAVNQDGASNGLTAPNGPSQQRVIRQALASAGLTTADVDVVEAHGTGTALGDPIEAQALLATYGRDREPEHPLWLGSVKSNIGHTQAAAGVAGVIKMIMALRHEMLPATLHADEPTPHVDWTSGAVELLTSAREWPTNGHPRRAAVSSFGISGTNAHVVLEEAPDDRPEPGPAETAGPVAWVISGRGEPAVAGQAARLAGWLRAHPGLGVAEVGRSLLSTRTLFENRTVVIGTDPDDFAAGLEAAAEGVPHPRVVSGSAGGDSGVVFVFPGQGGQWAGMGRGLLASSPVFAARMDECEAALAPHVSWSLRDVLGDEEALARVDVVQPVLWAVMVSIAAVWESWGVRPAAVIGHSQGEIAAAVVAGALSLADGARVVALRSAALRSLSGTGTMLSVAAAVQERPGVSVAAVNAVDSVVLSGTVEALQRVVDELDADVRTRWLPVDYASHSPAVAALRDELAEVLAGVEPGPSRVPLYSTVTASVLDTTAMDAAYWYENLRTTVDFHGAVTAAGADGYATFVEVSPHPVLSPGIQDGIAVGSLRRDQPDREQLLTAAAQLFVTGTTVDWNAANDWSAGERWIELPTYAFQRRRYWLESGPNGDASGLGQGVVEHPLLGAAVGVAEAGTVVLTGLVSARTHPWVADHAVFGSMLLPGTAFVELAVCAADQVGCGRVEELVILTPLILGAPDDPAVTELQVVVGSEQGSRGIDIYSRTRGDGTDRPWTRHATGTLAPEPADRGAGGLPQPWPPGAPIPIEDHYDRLAATGLGYGPAFRGLRGAWRHDGDIYAEVALPDAAADGGYGVHPALLDAALHAVGFTGIGADTEAGAGLLPFSWTGVELHATAARALRVRLHRTAADTVTLTATDPLGAPVITIEGLTLRPVSRDRLRPAARDLYTVEWTPHADHTGAEPAGSWAVLGSAELCAALLAAGADARLYDTPDDRDPADAVGRVLELVQSRLQAPETTPLVVLTDHAVGVQPGDPVHPAAAAVWGLVRSVQTEHPGRVVLIDSDSTTSGTELLRASVAGEPEVAVRDGVLYTPRLVPETAAGLELPGTAWRLTPGADGSLESVSAEPVAAAAVGAGEVRVRVLAAGVNFRDVLIGLGLYPGAAVLGSEGAGVVEEVGAEVTGIEVGDRVMGLFVGGFGPSVVVDRRTVTSIPAGWSFAQAASVPVVFLTAWYGLRDLAQVRSGERLLIHAAAGGVGMAATQLARLWGLDVCATASPGKWAAVDVERIASSRELGFGRVLGEVDVVLNSLTGEFLDESLSMLGAGGRLIDMGKLDVRDPGEVAERYPGVRYRRFDLAEAGLDRIQQMLAELAALFESGALSPLPTRSWDARRAVDALRFVQQARHIGKVVLTIPQPWNTEGTVLITGGTGVLGAALARHLAATGTTGLVLTSRRGADAPGAAELIAELAGAGAAVEVVACDVADRQAVAALLTGIPKLTAVVHAAGVLDDGVVESLTPRQVRSVLAAKADAARHLHELIGERTLVLFSSAAAAFGNAGQANYAAANAYLDALATARRAQGLPAVSIGWGLWEQASAMTGALTGADHARMIRGGMRPLPTSRGLALFDAAVTGAATAVLAIDLDHGALRRHPETIHPLLRDLVRAQARRVAADDAETPAGAAARLAAMTEPQRYRYLSELVRGHAATVLGHRDASGVDTDRAFRDLGFDSLTAVELRNRLASSTGVALPSTLIFDHPTPESVTRLLLRTLLTDTADRPTASPTAAATGDAIAVVGMACRFPGGIGTPEQLWELVIGAGDAITVMPDDRGWDIAAVYNPDPAGVGTSYSREGGFLHDAGDFDAGFFGISPREALAMDPQQRLMLEVAWEALESAGVNPKSLRDSDTGVFAGVTYHDHASRLRSVPEGLEGLLGTGSSASVVSGRLSYVLGLQGPAMTIDTACSSSLVATHLAAQALRGGECSLALAGGVTVMATPSTFVDFSRQQGLAADGRCKAFDAAADGFGPAEGVGVLVLERLSDARAKGHPVLAVLRGSAVNQDGASNGLTAPNGPAQQRVIRQALASGGLRPSEVDVVEAHGTGTALGDPIEAQALIATYGQDRDEPLWLGSIKSNIGHTQAAAGVAGVIKMIMALRHEVLPATLHVDEPTPHVDWSSGAVSLLRSAREWPVNGHPRRAGVSSFGISGTNAHVILEQAPDSAEPEPLVAEGPVAWALSARGPEALVAQGKRLASWVREHPELDPVDIGWSLSTRSVFEDRAVVVGRDRDELLAALAAGVVAGRKAGGLSVIFGGQGSQWVGMGRELAAAFPVFAEALDEVCGYLDESLRGVIDDDPVLLNETRYTQQALFAVEVALFRLLESWSITPDYVLGHSIGGLAAAHVAGVLSLPDAARVVAERGRLMQRLPGGAMVSIRAGEREVRGSLVPGVSIAAVNAVDAVVISGDEDAVLAVAARWGRTKRLAVSHAFHSAHMDAVLGDFARVLEGVELLPPRIPVVSDRTGELLTVEQATSVEYWVSHVRETVQFSKALDVLADTHHLDVMKLLRGERELLEGVARAFTAGTDVDWSVVKPGRRVPLPTYAFQHERYWLESTTDDTAFWQLIESGDDDTLTPVRDALAAWRSSRRAHAQLDSWRYRITWKSATEPLGTGVLTGTWLIVTASGLDELTAACARALTARGATIVVTDAPDELPGTAAPFTGVLSLLGLLDLPDSTGVTPGLARTVRLIQTLSRKEAGAPLWSVTRGAVSTGAGDELTAPAQAMVWGLGRVAGLEHPARWGGLIDLPPDVDADAERALCAVLSGTTGEDQVAIRPTGVFLRRLLPAPANGALPGVVPVAGGTVLITGGTGALGAHVARWAAAQGASRILLLSRRGPDTPGAGELIAELRPSATEIAAVACDITDHDAVAGIIAAIPDEHPLTTVVHTAGVSTRSAVADLDTAGLAAVTAAKVGGALVLHRVLAALPNPVRLVLFSSAAGIWGGGGQGAYSAANAYLDALAEHRAATGAPTTAVAWGPWAAGGMVDRAASEQLDRRGLILLPPDAAVRALHRALELGDTAITVADMNWSRFYPAYADARQRPLLGDLPQVAALLAAAEPDPGGAGHPALVDRLAELSEAEQRKHLLELVRSEAAGVLGHASSAAVPTTRGFLDSGFDSLLAVEFRNRLGVVTGLALPSTLLFDYPTVAAVAEHLHDQLFDVDAGLAAALERLEAILSRESATDDVRLLVKRRIDPLLNGRPDANANPDRFREFTPDDMFKLIDDTLGLGSADASAPNEEDA
ncbi:type I polyketide synthase [Nocardia sp. NPDC057353]|uniref:type I polyketide synthase n=1 Tax=Nocardia sp. NPDC057353 TaxID=3346104 RepID=UPI0036322C4B